MKPLPRYSISINPELSVDGENLGIEQVALTNNPAIIIKGMAFKSEVPKKMVFTDNLKYRLAAPALIPDLPIHRKDDDLGEYEVIFTKETILQLREKFMNEKGSIVFNLDHTTQEAPSYILEEWITGPSATDKSFTEYGIELPEGSWFILSQFVDREFFKNEIIAKDRLGYSIEGFLGMQMSNITKQLKEQMSKSLSKKDEFINTMYNLLTNGK